MPSDASIYGNQQSFRLNNLTDSLLPILQMQRQRQVMQRETEDREKQQREDAEEARREAALREVFADPNPKPSAIIKAAGPVRGIPIVNALATLRQGREADLRKVWLGFAALPEGLRTEAYGPLREKMIADEKITPDMAPEQYDAQWFAQTLAYGQEPKTPGTREVKTRNPDGSETVRIVADTPGQTFESVAPVKESTDLEGDIRAASKRGDAQEVRRLLNLKGQIAAAGRAPEKPPTQPWQWVTRTGPNGPEEVYTNRAVPGDRPQNARVKATEDERKTAGFYGQMSDSITLMDQLEGNLTETELYQIQSLPQEKLIGMLNRNEMSEGAKRYLRAFEQFTEARLRPVSGAAISDSEFARDRRTYARQYAETPKLAEDRKRARTLALQSLRKRAGVALDDANSAGDDAEARAAALIKKYGG